VDVGYAQVSPRPLPADYRISATRPQAWIAVLWRLSAGTIHRGCGNDSSPRCRNYPTLNVRNRASHSQHRYAFVKNKSRSTPRRRDLQTWPPHSGHFNSARVFVSRAVVLRFRLQTLCQWKSRNRKPNWTRWHLMQRYGLLNSRNDSLSMMLRPSVGAQCVLLQRGQYIIRSEDYSLLTTY
jgi:hypothetical protein